MKVTVIGAGSTYTPELVSGLAAQRSRLAVDELVLMDIDAERLQVVGGFAQRMLAHQGLPTDVRLTTDRTDAVRDADAVLVQLRVGGQAARLADETFPLECGCLGQETTGAGGLAKALRTVPVVLDIADEVRRIAKPDAWFIDFTNPVGIVTRALLDAGHRAIGLCNYAIGVQRWMARLLEVDPVRVDVDPVGLNHFSWMRRVFVDGEDVLPRLLDERIDELLQRSPFPEHLVRMLGALPSYYLRYYYFHDATVAAQRAERPRAAVVADLEAELLELYRSPDLVEKPAQLEHRGGAFYSEAAVDLLASLHADEPTTHVINVRNDGLIPGLADDDVVETRCLVSRTGVEPLPQPQVPPVMLGAIQHVSAYERIAARAALSGDEDDVRRALLAHPLVGQWELVEQLLPRLLETSAAHLPRFAR
ncbi:6-phospho-beta-glucosidase [Nocardioides sp. YIM 152315]|uniref:6-phospho-beta-glucosidase n=1 Tax=Nocardioides sp. YIM 152315 TaxID=3031760 RepID=UPI0023DB4D67|nr:6-phospho-beta-glucosidase [Nocardioides sp. YIM 152315]MDF1605785.1 6-phospho-beta-glucosidase [Nocardioides sp. YIM 152315]